MVFLKNIWKKSLLCVISTEIKPLIIVKSTHVSLCTKMNGEPKTVHTLMVKPIVNVMNQSIPVKVLGLVTMFNKSPKKPSGITIPLLI